MGDNSHVLPHGEPGSHHLFVGLRRVVPETVETAPDPEEPSAARVVRQQVPAESGGLCLGSGEVAKLLRPNGKEPAMIRPLSGSVTHMNHYSRRMGDELLRQ